MNSKYSKYNTPIYMLVQPEKLLKSASEMPPATRLWSLNGGAYIAEWRIDGYFASDKARAFLVDAIARFVQTFGPEAVKPLHEKPEIEPNFERKQAFVMNLKEFTKTLESLRRVPKSAAPQFVSHIDETFWYMKFFIEEQLTQNRIPDVRTLEKVGAQYAPHKERSTIRAKARSILRWYAERGYEPTHRSREARRKADHERYLRKTQKSEEELMTREQAAAVARKALIDETKSKIERGLMILQMEGRKVTVRALAAVAQVSTTTAQKYLKQLRANGAI